MNPEETADRFDNRAGYRLVAYGDVGLPLYRLTAIGLCLAKKTLDPIEEFVLRSVMAGADRVGDAAGVLGLEEAIVESCLAELVRTECVRVLGGGGDGERVELTAKGRDLASDHEATVPIEQTVVFYVDGLTRAPRFYPAETVSRPRELKEQGMPEVRAFPARAPELGEIDIKDVIDVVRLDTGRAESPRQLLRINTIERRERVFLPATALAYRAETGGTVQIAFAIDGRLSAEHERAFARAGGPAKTKVFRGLQERATPPRMEEVLGKELGGRVESAARASGNADELRREAREVRARLDGGPHEVGGREECEGGGSQSLRRKLRELQAELEGLEVRPLAVYEHPPLLKRALEDSAERVLIVSPWIRRAVVTRQFVDDIRRALDRGVEVYIGYGLGGSDGNEGRADEEARKELGKLAEAREEFAFKRLGDTHAKVLIKDRDFFVISSFNWLSFRGDANRTFREEWGALVGIPGVVDDYFRRMVRRFGSDEVGSSRDER